MRSVGNLLIIAAVGVILADMINNAKGTNALFCNLSNLWGISVSGMLGQEYKAGKC